MAVNISIKDEPQCRFIDFHDDDPIYWFLYPYFEQARREVGQMVDLYGDAEFVAEHLLRLFLILEKAEAEARSRVESWPVTIGYRDNKPLERTVLKSDVLNCIATLKFMLNDAYDRGLPVICYGD